MGRAAGQPVPSRNSGCPKKPPCSRGGVVTEITSAITRKLRGGLLSAAQAGASLGHLRRHLNHRYAILDLTPALADDAMLLARTHGLRAYDAVQLFTALAVRDMYRAGGFGSGTLISADQPLNAAATAEGLTVDDPNLHP